MTTEPGVAGLQARTQAELAPRLMVQLQRLNWDANQLAAHQAERLRALLARAIEGSPFHARRLAHIDPARFELADLPRLPTMTKAEMMASFDEVVTDRRLTRRRVEDHLHGGGRQAALLLGDYVCLTTGGSSRQRGVFVQMIGEYADMAAALKRNSIARLLAAGRSPDGMVIAMVAAAAPTHTSGFVAAAASFPAQMVPVPVTLPLAEAVERLNALQPAALIGYPSRLAQLAAEQRAGRLRIAPQSVTTTSAMLTDATRAAITAGFGVPVINSFACTEGLTGTSEPGEPVLTFATDLCIAELVDARGEPVADGTPSANVLITNLHNLTQPLIRYELTDSFTARPGTEAGGYLRATVEGRDDGMLRYGRVGIPALAVDAALASSAPVTEYQVRQTERGIDVAVVAPDGLDQAALTAALAGALRRAGLPDPEVNLRVVAAIARRPDTGKARRFIPSEDDATTQPTASEARGPAAA